MNLFANKKLILISLVVGVLLSSIAFAATGKVSGGKHDFSVTGSSFVYKDSASALGGQVCVFCHTPHNAGQTKLLWNKASGGNTSFRLYTSSGTLSSAANQSALTASSPSLFCLSCHDGKTALNVLHTGGKGNTVATAIGLAGTGTYDPNAKLAFGTTAIVMEVPTWMFGTYLPAPGLGESTGDDLTNDHPIGFSYTDSQTAKTAASLHASPDSRIRFFGTKKNVECSTCHDPHVDNTDGTQNPFLVMPNANSALCLACHNK